MASALRYWNIFDTVIVACAGVDIIFTIAFGTQNDGFFLTFLRTLRITRLARIIRLLRYMRNLLLLVVGLGNAIKLLFWVWLLLFFIIFTFGIVMTRMVGQPYGDEYSPSGLNATALDHMWEDPTLRSDQIDALYHCRHALNIAKSDERKLWEWMGTVPRSMFTLFEIMTTESWAEIAETAMDKNGMALAIILIYMAITTYAMVNVVVAVTVNSTLDSSIALKEDDVRRATKEKLKTLKKLCEVFYNMDTNGDGTVSQDEFHRGLSDETVATMLEGIGFHARDCEDLFDIIDRDENGVLELEEFCTGLHRAIQDARGQDLLEIHCDLWKAYRRQKNFVDTHLETLDLHLKSIERKLKQLTNAGTKIVEPAPPVQSPARTTALDGS